MAGKAGCRGRQQGEGTCHCVAAEADSFSYTQIWPHASPTASPPFSPLETGTQWSYLPVPQGSHSQAGRVPAHRWCQAASESRGSGTKWHRSGAPAQEGTLGKHKSSQSSTCKLQRAPSIPCTEGYATPGPGHSPGQAFRLHSCHCCMSRVWHGTPPGRSLQVLWRTMVPPPQTAEHSLQADQGPRTGHSRYGHNRDPLMHVLWTRRGPRDQAPSCDRQLSLSSSAHSLDLPLVTHPKPLAWQHTSYGSPSGPPGSGPAPMRRWH